MSKRVTRSMTRKKEDDEIKRTIDEMKNKRVDDFARSLPAGKPTFVPDNFSDFDDAYEMEDDWEMGEGSDFDDMDIEDINLRF